ncbi:MAG: NUDIX hydrolase [Defluviitaleaceae bacterium]|nr:NUDIX hydrolase [Defluviitaleaceae bacterium]
MEIYNGRVVRLVVEEIALPNGGKAQREVVYNPDYAAVLPVDCDGNIWFVRQYRHSVRRQVLEIPAGIIDAGETPEQCALRELEEEIGKRVGKLNKICTYHGNIGICSGKGHLFLAEDLTDGKQNFDEDEFITVEKYSLEKARRMIADEEIVCGKTIMAIFAYISING